MEETNNNKEEQGIDEENMYDLHQIKVDKGQSPIRIDKFIQDKLFGITRNKVQVAIKAGAVKVGGKVVKSNYKIRPNDDIEFIIPKRMDVEDGILAQDIPINIHYEDDDLMVVNKAAGMVVHPGVGNPRDTLVNAVAHYLKGTDLPIKEGNLADRPGLVHRIDKDTSGLLVIAKNEHAMSNLAKQFYDHTSQRRYVALVWGEPEEDEGTIVGNIGRDLSDRTCYKVFPDEDEIGKHAVTHYKVLERLYYVSLVECRLETGRTHQIRVHMKHLGHPLFNDRKYGGDRIRKGTVYSKYKMFVHNCFKLLQRQALHAKLLGFEHPVSGETMLFESELPEDIQACVEKWRGYMSSRKD